MKKMGNFVISKIKKKPKASIYGISKFKCMERGVIREKNGILEGSHTFNLFFLQKVQNTKVDYGTHKY